MGQTQREPVFQRVAPNSGYLPIEDHGLLGDGESAALVDREGNIAWLCAPRFDRPPVFCGILDQEAGGDFQITLTDLLESRQYYLPGSGVLVTELRSATGVLRIRDALILQAGADLTEHRSFANRELLRVFEVVEGVVAVQVHFKPRGGISARREGADWAIRPALLPASTFYLSASFLLQGPFTPLRMWAGERHHLSLRWGEGKASDAEAAISATHEAWRRYLESVEYSGPQPALVRRSALVLKMLDHHDGGALVAAPTSSLPEAIGGERNWDYRYAWIRDSAFSVYAMSRIGFPQEARQLLDWLLRTVTAQGEPRVLYTLDGVAPPPEMSDLGLAGYRNSLPVRWGNGAADQIQHDVYGEILDLAYLCEKRGLGIDPWWPQLCRLVETAAVRWSLPDQGIWEVRVPGRVFTYSAAMCQVALDRGARLARRRGEERQARRWGALAAEIRDRILKEAWCDRTGSLTEHLGGGGLDASLLMLPLRGLIRGDDPRMRATTEAVVKRLGAGQGLLYRYLPEESPDGLRGGEGAFLLCSFWLVDNLVLQGRLDEAHALYDDLCARANPLGLLPEQIDAASGAFLGNYPQAFSHLGVINSGINLALAR